MAATSVIHALVTSASLTHACTTLCLPDIYSPEITSHAPYPNLTPNPNCHSTLMTPILALITTCVTPNRNGTLFA